jgi:hypothetical protein
MRCLLRSSSTLVEALHLEAHRQLPYTGGLCIRTPVKISNLAFAEFETFLSWTVSQKGPLQPAGCVVFFVFFFRSFFLQAVRGTSTPFILFFVSFSDRRSRGYFFSGLAQALTDLLEPLHHKSAHRWPRS